MQKIIAALALTGASAFVAPKAARAGVAVQETKADLEKLAVELNPIVGFWDPLSLADAEFWDTSNEQTIGFLRHAEIKHGRVAMAGFVGYCLHANGFQFPLHIPGDYSTKSPAELWDQVPTNGCACGVLPLTWRVDGVASRSRRDSWSAETHVRKRRKLQMLGFIAFLEFFGELGSRVGAPAHYMRGGLPGAYPSFKKYLNGVFPHPVPLDLYDPFGIFSNASPEKKVCGGVPTRRWRAGGIGY